MRLDPHPFDSPPTGGLSERVIAQAAAVARTRDFVRDVRRLRELQQTTPPKGQASKLSLQIRAAELQVDSQLGTLLGDPALFPPQQDVPDEPD